MALSEISTSCASTDGDCLFEGLAQIMVRKDIGWEPMGVGGMSTIIVRQKQDNSLNYAYFIEFCGPCDDDVITTVLSKIDHNTNYFRITPTFHSWINEKKERFGLTFDTFDAAEKFSYVFEGILKELSPAADCVSDNNAAICTVIEVEDDYSSTSGAVVSDEWVVKGWGSCQHLSQVHIPDTMKCFQSPAEASCSIYSPDFFLEQNAFAIAANAAAEYVSTSDVQSTTRHCRSGSASSAPCLLRLNTNSNGCLESVLESYCGGGGVIISPTGDRHRRSSNPSSGLLITSGTRLDLIVSDRNKTDKKRSSLMKALFCCSSTSATQTGGTTTTTNIAMDGPSSVTTDGGGGIPTTSFYHCPHCDRTHLSSSTIKHHSNKIPISAVPISLRILQLCCVCWRFCPQSNNCCPQSIASPPFISCCKATPHSSNRGAHKSKPVTAQFI